MLVDLARPALRMTAPLTGAARSATGHDGAVPIGLVLDSRDPEALAPFWAAALGYVVSARSRTTCCCCPTDDDGPKLLLQRVPEDKADKNRMHLDIEVADIEAVASQLVALGATRLEADVHEEHDCRWIVMADPEGNEFCVCFAEAVDEPSMDSAGSPRHPRPAGTVRPCRRRRRLGTACPRCSATTASSTSKPSAEGSARGHGGAAGLFRPTRPPPRPPHHERDRSSPMAQQRARVRCKYLVVPDDGRARTGEYHDDVVRDARGWRIERRTVVPRRARPERA